MSNLPAILTQRYLTDVIREWPSEAFIGADILPLRGVEGMETMWDIIMRDDNLAPFVAINAESGLADEADMKRGFSELADIRQKSQIKETDILNLRMAGEPDVVTGLQRTLASVAQENVDKKAQRLTSRVRARVEWMRWQALSTGSISYDDNKVKFTVDFGVPSGQIVTLTAGDRWSVTASADPIGDINSWVEAYISATGRRPTRMYVGDNIATYLANNTAARDLLKYNGRIEAQISTGTVLDYLGSIFNLRIERYSASYQASKNASGTFYLGADKCVLMCDPVQPDGERLGDVATGPAKANDYQTGEYTWVKEEEDPWVTFVGVGIHAFPRIFHPTWIYIANVNG